MAIFGRFMRFPSLDFSLIIACLQTAVVVDLGQNFPFRARMFHFGNGSGNLGRMSSDLGPSSPHSARRTTWSSPRWRRSPYLHSCTVLGDIPVSREQNLENALSSVNPRRKATSDQAHEGGRNTATPLRRTVHRRNPCPANLFDPILKNG